MAIYDFRTLSPLDFEELCHDLLEKELGMSLELFKPGRDTGIDLRHAFTIGENTIIQCKHYVNSGFGPLLRTMKRDEAPKISRLAPTRYILATSVSLTPNNSSDLVTALSPHCKGTSDIYGAERLNAALRKYPEICQSHFKLWLTSEALLQRILQNCAFVQSEIERESIITKIKLFVQTAAVRKAKDILDKEHTCIISGEPGIGKTTLAQILLATFLSNDWELVTANEHMKEILDVYSANPEKKQVFYYDDFLGQINLHDKQLAKNEDKSILQFITYVRGNPNKRFILTTREYILRQATLQSELLSSSKLEINKYLLTLADYTEEDKARILANHLYFYDVSQDCIKALLKDRSYYRIVRHPNYNPRIIEHMTDARQLCDISASDYVAIFLRNLDNPSLIWKHVFDRKLNHASRNLLLIFASMGTEVLVEDLKQAYEKFHLNRAKRYNFEASPSDFLDALKILENSFIRIKLQNGGSTVTPLNPSIMDFLQKELRDNLDLVNELLEEAFFFEQSQVLFRLMINGADKGGSASKLAGVAKQFARAVQRLLESYSSNIIVQHWTKPPEVKRISINAATRIQFVAEIAAATADIGCARTAVKAADAFFKTLTFSKPSVSVCISLIEDFEKWKLASDSELGSWRTSLAECFDSTIDDIDEAKQLAEWIENYANIYSEDQIKNAAQLIEDVVESSVQDVGNSDLTIDSLQNLLFDLKEIACCSYIDIERSHLKVAHALEIAEDKKIEMDRERDHWRYDDDDHWLPSRRTNGKNIVTHSKSPTPMNREHQSPIDRIFDSF